MPVSRNRDIAKILGVTEAANPTNAVLTSAADGSGLVVYATLDDLPTSGLTSGDQAYITSTNRLYVSNGSGWYNVALFNATPSLTIDPTGAIELSTEGATTAITLTATDSDNAVAGLTYSVESDGSFAGLGTISQDSSVFTITPLSEDSATTGTSTLTFKASDGISFGSGQRTFTLTFATPIANSSYTTLLAKADTAGTDNQVDASSNANTITQVGTVNSTALSPYHPGGYSTYFDGTGDYLTIPDDASLELGSNSFTIEGWVYPNNITSTQSIYCCSTNGSGYAGVRLDINGGQFELTMGTGTTTWTILFQDVGAVSKETWNHFALVRNGNTDVKFYINGANTYTSTAIGSLSLVEGTTVNTISLGRFSEDTLYYDGYISDLRVVNGTAVYTSNFTPPTEPLTAIANTSLLTCNLPYIADGSSNDHTITIVGNTTTKRFGPFDYSSYSKSTDGGSVYVGGATSYLSTNLPAMTGDWTIEGWIQHTANTGTSSQNRIFGGATNDPMILNTGLTSLNVYIDNNLKITANAAANTAASLNRWYHMALVRETTGNTLKLYINGKLAGSQSSGSYDIDAKDPFGIGSDANSSAYGMTGYIADFRVVNGTAVYTAEFTPPTEPLTEITNTDLLTCTNKNDIWDEGSGSLLTKAGNATSSNTQRKFTTSSAMYFDGTGDYITVNHEALGTGNWTIEGWVRFNTIGSQYIFDFRNASTANFNPALDIQNDWRYITDTNYRISTGVTPSANTWYHFAIVKNNETTTLYINGSSLGFFNDVIDYVGEPAATIGAFRTKAANYLDGYLQDFRVTKGLARYTSNFTPPTAEFEG